VKFQIVTVVCPQCGATGFHKDVDQCLEALQKAIDVRRGTFDPPTTIRRRPSPQYLRRDRCDVPKTDITKKP